MFAVNKEGKLFLIKNFTTIRNGFINDGLVPFNFGNGDFNRYMQLEKLYFNSLERNIENRVITISIEFKMSFEGLNHFIKVVKLIKEEQVKLKFKVKIDGWYINY